MVQIKNKQQGSTREGERGYCPRDYHAISFKSVITDNLVNRLLIFLWVFLQVDHEKSIKEAIFLTSYVGLSCNPFTQYFLFVLTLLSFIFCEILDFSSFGNGFSVTILQSITSSRTCQTIWGIFLEDFLENRANQVNSLNYIQKIHLQASPWTWLSN